MPKLRRFVVIAMLGSALAADRVAVAAPVLRPQVINVARRFTRRLVVSFRRTIPAAAIREYRQRQDLAPAQTITTVVADEPVPSPFDGSPALYRLPPPAL